MTQHLLFWLSKYELIIDLTWFRLFGIISGIRPRVLLYYTVPLAFSLHAAAVADDNLPVVQDMHQKSSNKMNSNSVAAQENVFIINMFSKIWTESGRIKDSSYTYYNITHTT